MRLGTFTGELQYTELDWAVITRVPAVTLIGRESDLGQSGETNDEKKSWATRRREIRNTTLVPVLLLA